MKIRWKLIYDGKRSFCRICFNVLQFSKFHPSLKLFHNVITAGSAPDWLPSQNDSNWVSVTHASWWHALTSVLASLVHYTAVYAFSFKLWLRFTTMDWWLSVLSSRDCSRTTPWWRTPAHPHRKHWLTSGKRSAASKWNGFLIPLITLSWGQGKNVKDTMWSITHFFLLFIDFIYSGIFTNSPHWNSFPSEMTFFCF